MGGTFANSLSISTDSNGLAAIYLQPGGADGALNKVSCTGTSSSGVQSTVYLTAITQGSSSGTGSATPGGGGSVAADPDPGALSAPTNVTVVETDTIGVDTDDDDYDPVYYTPTKVTISWNASNADGYIVQEQVSGGPWAPIPGGSGVATTCTQAGLLANQNRAGRASQQAPLEPLTDAGVESATFRVAEASPIERCMYPPVVLAPSALLNRRTHGASGFHIGPVSQSLRLGNRMLQSCPDSLIAGFSRPPPFAVEASAARAQP